MKRYAYITLIAVALVLATSSVAFGAATRIVVMDLNAVINESEAGKAQCRTGGSGSEQAGRS